MRAELRARGRLALLGAIPLALGAACGTKAPQVPPQTPVEEAKVAHGKTCDDPLRLPLGELVLGSTRDARDTVRPKCASGAAPDRIYRVHVETRSEFRAMLQGDFDAVLALRESCGHEAREVACNDDVRRGQSQRSRIDATLTPGDYYLVIDGSRGASGDYELFAFVDPIEGPGVACESAIPLAFGETARGSTLGLPDRFQATCGQGAKAGERVYRIEVDAPSRLRVLQQTEYDGVLHLRARCEVPTSEVACNDDFRGPHRSLLTARVEAGTYFLFADGLENPQAGTFSLRAERGPLHPTRLSASQVCEAARALPLSPGTVEVDTFHEPGHQRGSCGGEGAPESVFALEVEQPSRLRVRLHQPEFNAVLYLRGQCEGRETEQVCERQTRVDRRRLTGQPPARSLDVEVAPGTHYLFVDGFGPDDFGAAQLQVDLRPLSELRGVCAQGRVLRDGDVVEARLGEGASRFGASCGGEARGPEHVYRLELPRRAMVQLDLDSSFDGVLHLRQDCSRLEGELACNDDAGHSRRSSVSSLLEAGSYQVFVDGFDPRDLGPYRLKAQISSAP